VYVRVVSEGVCYVKGEGNYLAATLLKLNSISFDNHLGLNSLIDVEEILL
jgi:hypothetical protein